MGMAQSLALLRLGCFRRRSLVDLQWIAATVARMLLGGFATGIARVTLSEPVRVLWDYEGAGVFWELSWPFLCGLAVGAFQQAVLREENPLRWAVPSAIGWLAGFAVGAIPIFVMPASDVSRAFQVTGPAGTGIIVGIVTGAALIWLLAHPARPDGGSPPGESPAITPMTWNMSVQAPAGHRHDAAARLWQPDPDLHLRRAGPAAPRPRAPAKCGDWLGIWPPGPQSWG